MLLHTIQQIAILDRVLNGFLFYLSKKKSHSRTGLSGNLYLGIMYIDSLWHQSYSLVDF